MAIDADVTAELGAFDTRAGGRFAYRAVRGADGREKFLITFAPPGGGASRHLLVPAFALRSLIEAAEAFLARDTYTPGESPRMPETIAEREGRGHESQIPAAQRRALPWTKR